MNAYIYQADLHCESCTERIKEQLRHDQKVPATPDDERTYDSDEYPKGPYGNGGGESDSPQHCGTCGKFLENPLTSDGLQYLREMLECGGPSNDEVRKQWAEFYKGELALTQCA